MPREFQDFSQEVSQGTDKIKSSLDAVRSAADNADVSSGRLSSTQDAGTRIADSYSKSMAGLSKELTRTASGGSEAARGLAQAESAIRSLASSSSSIGDVRDNLNKLRDVSQDVASSFERLTGRKIGINIDAESAKVARDSIMAVEESVSRVDRVKASIDIDSSQVEKTSKKMKELEKLTVEQQVAAQEGAIIIDRAIKQQKEAIQALTKTKRKLTDAEEQDLVKRKISLAQLEAFKSTVKDATSDLNGFEQALLKGTVSTKNLNKAMVEAASKSQDFANRAAAVNDEIIESSAFDILTKDMKAYQSQIKKLEAAQGNLSKGQKGELLGANIDLGKFRELNDLLASGELEESTQKMVSNLIVQKQYAKAIEEAAKANAGFAASLREVEEETIENVTASKKYTGEVDKARNVTDLINNKFQEGKKEAKGFAGGLGATNGRLIGTGVAMLFVGKKVAELVDQFKDARLELGRFNVDLANLEAQAGALGLDRSFGDIRNELNLTRDQSSKFFEVYKQGVQSGVVSSERLAKAAADIQKSFGGDPTEKLREFVDLLQSIPTLEADLSVTASLDDQAAALFGLAMEGKIGVLAELQTAGVIGGGGGGAQPLSEADVEILNAQQETAKTVEDVHDFLQTKLFPSWGIKFSAIAKGTSQVAMAVGGVVAAMGVLNVLTGKQIIAQNLTTAVIARGQATELAGDIGNAVSNATKSAVAPSLISGLKAIFTSGGGAAAAGGAATAAAPVAIAAAAVALGAAAMYGGSKLQEMGDEAEMSGNRFDAGLKQVAGSLLQIEGAAILLGPAGALGTLAFNMEELGSGFENLGYAAMTNAADMGDLGPAVFLAGNAMDDLGTALQNAEAALWEYVNSAKSAIVDGFKQLPGLLMTGYKVISTRLGKLPDILLGPLAKLGIDVDFVKDKLGDFAKSIPGVSLFLQLKSGADAYIEESNKLFAEQQQLNKAFAELRERSDANSKALEEDRMRIVRSGLALERQLNSTKAEFESAALKLSDLNAAVAATKLDQLSEFGGTAAEFDRAVAQSSSAVMKRFGELAEAGARSRARIVKDSSLDSKARKAALTELNRRELEATEEFVKGMEKVIDALFQTPQILIAGFERELAGAEIDIEIARGGGASDIGALISRETDAAIEALNETRNAREKAEAEIAKLEQARTKQVEAFKNEFVNQLKEMGKETDDATKEVSEAFKKRLIGEGVVTETDEGIEINTDKLTEGIEKTRASLEKSEAEIDRLRKSLNPESFASLALNLREYSNQQKASEAAAAEALEARKGATTDEERAEAAKKEAKAKVAAEEAQKKTVETSKKLVGLIQMNATLAGKEDQVQKAVAAAAEAFAQGQVPSIKALKKAGVDAEVAQEVVKQLGDTLSKSNDKTAENLRIELKKSSLDSKLLGVQEGLVKNGDMSAKQKQKQVEAAKKVAEEELKFREIIFEGIQKQLDAVAKTDAYIKSQRGVDFSETLSEVAEFSDDYASILRGATQLAIQASQERAALEAQAIEQGFEDAKKAIKANLASGKISQKTAQVQLEAADLSRRTELAKTEVKQKNAVLDAAKREVDLKMEAISLEEELIDAEADFLSEMGGSYDSILKLQQAGVALEMQKLEALRQQVETARESETDGVRLRKLEVAYEKQKFALARKQFGVQKDVFEKILGKAFGELQDTALTKGRGSDVSIMGRERTRVMGRSGLFLRTGMGGPGTLAQRAADRAIKSTFGNMGDEGPLKGLGEQPERTEIEKEIAEENKKNREANEKLTEEATNPGSIYTHDTHAEKLLQKILEALLQQASLSETISSPAGPTSAVEALAKNIPIMGPFAGVMKQAAESIDKARNGMVMASEQGAENQKKMSATVDKEGNYLNSLGALPGVTKEQAKQARENSKIIEKRAKVIEKERGKEAADKYRKEQMAVATVKGDTAMTEKAAAEQFKKSVDADTAARIKMMQNPLAVGQMTPEMKRIASGEMSMEQKAYLQKQEEVAKGTKKAAEDTARQGKTEQTEKRVSGGTPVALKKDDSMKKTGGDKFDPWDELKKRRGLGKYAEKAEKGALPKGFEVWNKKDQVSAVVKNFQEKAEEEKAAAERYGKLQWGTSEEIMEKYGTKAFKTVKAAEGLKSMGVDVMDTSMVQDAQRQMAVNQKVTEYLDASARTQEVGSFYNEVTGDELETSNPEMAKNLSNWQMAFDENSKKQTKSLNDVAKGKAVPDAGQKNAQRATEKGFSSLEDVVKEQEKADAGQNIQQVMAKAGKSINDVVSDGGVVDAGEKNKPAVKALSDRESREEQMRNQRASAEQIAGIGKGLGRQEFGGTSVMGGMPGGGGEEFRVGGMINIKLDTRMFKAEVEKVMAEKITSPQVREQLNKEYLNQNA